MVRTKEGDLLGARDRREIVKGMEKMRRDWVVETYMCNTSNLTTMEKSSFRRFRWIYRTNKFSVGEKFFRWKINDVMTHGKQILVNSDCSMDPMDPSDKRVYYRTNDYPMDI